MEKRPILAPLKPIADMSLDELQTYLKDSEADFISAFRNMNSQEERTEYLNKAIGFRETLIQGNEEKFKTANFFREYEQLNFQFFSSRKAELTEEFADNVRSDIRKLYTEVIDELLKPRLTRWKFDFKRMNEFKYFLNQIILNKHNYLINLAFLMLDQDYFKLYRPDKLSELTLNDLEKHFDVKADIPANYSFKKENYKIYIDGIESGESTTEVFEKFIKFSHSNEANMENSSKYGRLRPAAIKNNSSEKKVISQNVNYILSELNEEYSIGKQTYYNYFTFDDSFVINDFIKHKQTNLEKYNQILDDLKEKLIRVKSTEINLLNNEIESVNDEIKILNREISLLTKSLELKKNKSSREKLIEHNKKVEFDKKFFINLGMYLQLDFDNFEKFLNINGYSLESRNEQDTIIRILYQNSYHVETIDLVLTSYGYKSLRISDNRLSIMKKTSFEIANEYRSLDATSRALLSTGDRINYYRNIESALNLIELFFINRNYNKCLFEKMYSNLHKSDYDFVVKERTSLRISGHKPSFTGIHEKINQELDNFDDDALIRVDEIFKTKIDSTTKTYEDWRKEHINLLTELKTFDMYYGKFKSPFPEEHEFIMKSVSKLINRLEKRNTFVNDKLNNYKDEEIKLAALTIKSKSQKTRLEKVKLYIELLKDYNEEAMFYMRDSENNENIKFSDGITDYTQPLQNFIDIGVYLTNT